MTIEIYIKRIMEKDIEIRNLKIKNIELKFERDKARSEYDLSYDTLTEFKATIKSLKKENRNMRKVIETLEMELSEG